jgi:hypothetical protein
MKTHLLIYGTPNYANAINSLIKSSKNFFDNHHIFGPSDISEDFYKKNQNILDLKKGAGYFLWKPYIIHETLKKVNDGDIVFYVDAGNIFINDPTFIYEKLQENNGIILFDNRDGMQNGESAQNFISCKKDSFVLMDCDTDEYIFGKHLNASYQIYQKNNDSLLFVSEFLKFSQNIDIIVDTPNKFGDNYSGYYDHRYDQTVLSLLGIKHKIKPLVDPSEWGNKCGCRGFDQLFLHHRNPNYIM